jgi:signal transduction histidine kinase
VPYNDADCHQLLSLVAHEIRSPAAVIAGYLRLLLRAPAEPERQWPESERQAEPERRIPDAARRIIEEANGSCGRLLGLVKELGDLVSLEKTGSLRSADQVSVFSLCDEVVQAAALQGAEVTFSGDETSRPPVVLGDADRLRQALAALVAVIVRERGKQPLEVCGFVSREHGPGRAVIALGDPGIASRHHEILANQGAAFDQWRGGTGISVPIAYRIVEAHGGSVWSLPGESHAACALSLRLAKGR